MALVEFALVAPMLFGLLFGIVDFGYAYSRTLDVRHGTRETARLASVNYTVFSGSTPTTGDAQRALIISTACSRMDGGKGSTVSLSGGVAVGDPITVTVTRPLDSVSGIYGPLLDGKEIRSSVKIRTEVKKTWTAGSGTCS